MMADLGSGLRQLLQSLGASGAQAARSQRVAEVHVRWKYPGRYTADGCSAAICCWWTSPMR